MVLRKPLLRESLLHSQQYTFGVKNRLVGGFNTVWFLKFLFKKHTQE